ncbi:hypothetical protein F5Y19DRAFT_444304 [Xylariaceae sp. FL1651]|nr:hypothetical protein F5Y19DRAFT_444304 [Xylariaceae sp. FL1651]
MGSIADQIRSAASRNRELHAILSQTDYAAPALKQQKHLIQDLNAQLQDVKKQLNQLGQARWKEQKDYEQYRKSVVKRWAYKVSGNQEKFEAKAEKEEKEYFEVLQKLQQAIALEQNLQTMRSEALDKQNKLEQDVLRHTTAQSELDNLYASIFQGPTPSFPEEDDVERQKILITKSYNSIYAELEANQEVVRILEDVAKRVQSSKLRIENALEYSRLDMLGSNRADFMKRNALQNAEMDLVRAQMLIMQAQRFSSEVKNLPPIQIASNNLTSDVLFDNIFTDVEFHEKIKQSRFEAERCEQDLLAQLAAAKERRQASEEKAIAQSRLLDNARAELQKVRHQIFERVANGAPQTSQSSQLDEDAPPPYTG